ncbi:transient receptor potential cation channel subfamily V member 6-like [Haliotis rufescens]|uniref:transient receptor potential cation channel subfamily V member 6-like n=1 Tax=Haliotis rufescens TaxID=6454 RepID=UPI00201EEA7E|nr:transient receptor potential cation channel subfamily V member 6-like [Haliotis rufescens]XP_048245176.1 transient receptor potential cation channel subfamily V member 6-like [Haliotis rufescens]
MNPAQQQRLYQTDQQGFLKKLVTNVVLGRDKEEEAMAQLDVLQRTGREGSELLAAHRDKDETLLNLAAKFHEDVTVMKKIIEVCPGLLLVSRTGEYEGQTTLHIVISKCNYAAVKMLLKAGVVKRFKDQVLRMLATGSRFTNTVMMGELPLSVAALTLDTHILELMFKYGTSDMVSFQNSYGDTVFHSLIKYACLHPDKTNAVIEMCHGINKRLGERPTEEVLTTGASVHLAHKDPMTVWFLPNYSNQTPMQLAASLEQVDIFRFILNIEGVYCQLDRHDGLFDVHLYDITEIDTVSLTNWQRKNNIKMKQSQAHQKNKVSSIDTPLTNINQNNTRYNKPGANPLKQTYKPILETICEIDVQQAFEVLNLKVMRTIIRAKWSRYRWVYLTWAILHIIYILILTWYAVVKTEILNQQLPRSTTANTTGQGNMSLFHCVYTCVQHTINSEPQQSQTIPLSSPSLNKEYNTTLFVLVITILNIVIAVLIILFEIRRRIFQGYKFHLKKIHHNGTYRVLLCVFSVSLLVDSLWYLFSPTNNYLLILALLLGWWFLTFFLRALKKFSFFTVMIQKVLQGDAVRFAVIIILEFVSFTVALYITFLSTQPEGFRSLGETFLTLFNLMLGLTELNILTQARDPWLAITLFILFVLLTYVLMLNALIAMMSQTCAMVSENKLAQGELQRLSIILFLENIMPHRLKVCCGTCKKVKHFDVGQKTTIEEDRYFLEMDSLQTNYSKGSSIMKRKQMVQTLKFDNTSSDVQRYLQMLPQAKSRKYPEHTIKPIKEKKQRSQNLIEVPKPQDGGLSPVSRGRPSLLSRSSFKRKGRDVVDASPSDELKHQIRFGGVSDTRDTSPVGMGQERDDPPSKDQTDGLHVSLEYRPDIANVEI